MSCSFVYSTNTSEKLKPSFPSLHIGVLLCMTIEKWIDIQYLLCRIRQKFLLLRNAKYKMAETSKYNFVQNIIICFNSLLNRLYTRAGEPYRGRVPKLSVHFEESLSPAYGNFEEQNKILEFSINDY